MAFRWTKCRRLQNSQQHLRAFSNGIKVASKRAAEMAVSEVMNHNGGVELVIFVCFEAKTARIYRELLSGSG